MASKIDAFASRFQTAAIQKRVTGSMQGVIKALDTHTKPKNMEKVQTLINRLEKNFENLDIQSPTMKVSLYNVKNNYKNYSDR